MKDKKLALVRVGFNVPYKDPEERRKYNKEYRLRKKTEDPEYDRKCWEKRPYRKRKSYELLRLYGITLEYFDSMMEKQKGVCAICGQPESMVRNGSVCLLVVDHNKETGEIRGLLCNNCNRAIGMLRHDIDILRSAIDYLKK